MLKTALPKPAGFHVFVVHGILPFVFEGETTAYGSDRLRLLVSVRALIYRHSRKTRILFIGNISISCSYKRSVAVLAQTSTSQTIANGLIHRLLFFP